MKKPRRDMMLVALGGPITNFTLVAAFTLLGMILRLTFHVQLMPTIEWNIVSSRGGTWADLFLLLFWIVFINVILGIFNLIPVPPLDGSHILEYFLSSRSRETYESVARYGFVIIFAILIVIYFTGLSFLNPLFRVIENLLFGRFLIAF